jgi:hypothetical protein
LNASEFFNGAEGKLNEKFTGLFNSKETNSYWQIKQGFSEILNEVLLFVWRIWPGT